MRHIILMRHGEAGYAVHSQSDFDRPLLARGATDARQQASILKNKGLLPDIVLCSPALRTLSTWRAMEDVLRDDLSIDFELRTPEILYQASKQTICDQITRLDDRIDIALILSHNPGVHEAAQLFSHPRSGQEHTQQTRSLHSSFTPANMAIFGLTGRSWFDASQDTLTLQGLHTI